MELYEKRYFRWLLLGIALLLLVVGRDRVISPVEAAPTAATIHVDVAHGQDTASCGAVDQPCASIQHGVNKVKSGSTIKVAKGTYTFNKAADQCSGILGTTAVVCVFNKDMTIIGGYAPNNWNTPAPKTNVTIIDGQNRNRGVLGNASTLTLEGFTVQNGRVQGASSGDDSKTFAFGAGLLADHTLTVIRNTVFKNNQALGGNTSSNYGGAAVGGGVALRRAPSGSALEGVIFSGNKAIGGRGGQRGGFGIGGGFYTFDSSVRGSYLTFTNNYASGGSSDGSGIGPAGDNADGQGGAAAFHQGSTVKLDHLTVENNNTAGGNAPNGQGGGGFGGGLWAENSNRVEIVDARIFKNEAIGGNGKNASRGGSVSFAGGLGVLNTTLIVNRAQVLDNRSIGGNGTVLSGSGNGGGLSLTRTLGDSRAEIVNSVFANNEARMGTGNVSGGGGGGIYMRGAQANIRHVTVAQNEIGAHMQGGAFVLLSSSVPATANIRYTIIAQHTVPSSAYAVHAQPGNTVNLDNGLFDGNSNNQGGGGPINGLGSMLYAAPAFRSPGTPDYDYHIKEHSAARDAASSSNESLDVEGDARDSKPDIGADEYMLPGIASVIVSQTSDTSAIVRWASHGGAIDRFRVGVTCSAGASRPNELACGATTDVAAEQQQFQLTGLSVGGKYGVAVSALDSGGNVLDSSTAEFTAIDLESNFLPLVMGK